MQMPTIDVKPLEWIDSTIGDMKRSGAYRVQTETYGQSLPFWSYGSQIMGHDSDPDALISAANAHHAAHIRSQVAGVTLTDTEAYQVCRALKKADDEGASSIAAVQAAFAAMGVE
jgi:hypothetical protein